MEYQMRNWLYYTWLSGDFNVEQHVHSLDKTAWVMKDEPPVKAIGLGGRQVRTEPEYGNIYDHFAVVYEYANGVKLFSNCRQMAGCANDVSDYVCGTKGTAELMKRARSTARQRHWQLPRRRRRTCTTEHDELFASIRSGKPINNGEYMAKSTHAGHHGPHGLLHRQDAHLGPVLNSSEDLTPRQIRMGRDRNARGRHAGRHAVCVSSLEFRL